MSKVKVDTDKIGKELLPIAGGARNNLIRARNYASGVSYPYGEFDWRNIYNRIDDCVDQIDRYVRWMDSLNRNFVSNINNNLEGVSQIPVESIKVRDINVK